MNNLKQKIEITETTVECPVIGCRNIVSRKRRCDKLSEKHKCKKHNIYIFPSTFEYSNVFDNFLDNSIRETEVFIKINKYKRECRMGRERSEDALTWNIFRYLENNGLLQEYIKYITGKDKNINDVIYWSYSLKEKNQWKILNEARIEFGETIEKGTEPDIIIETDDTILFIEAKFTSSNKTSGSNHDAINYHITNTKKYLTGGNDLFKRIFMRTYNDIILDQKYELLRMWLIGNWIANRKQKKFILINLVPDGKEKDIETYFKPMIVENESSKFKRITWESIGNYLNIKDGNKMIIEYLNNKTIGYSTNGKLLRAFIPINIQLTTAST